MEKRERGDMTHKKSCEKDELRYEPIFVARQPIFDAKLNVWGYELLFRHSGDAKTANVTDQNLATSKVIADGFSLALQGLSPGKRVLINFPAKLIADGTALALPKENCVVEILETVKPTPRVLEACSKLKEAGYTLALDDFVGQPGFEPFLEFADLIKVEILGQTREQIKAITSRFKKTKIKLLAEKVEDKETFEFVKKLGYDYFQGYFFSKPEIVPGRKIASSAMAKIELLKLLNQQDCEFDALSKVIGRDISLSYRLLRFINSSAFSLRYKVESITQAITLLGLRPLKQWAMVVLMSDIDASPRGEVLIYFSLQRARFLEQIQRFMPQRPFQPETMFLLGLFSKLDALLGLPMADILKDMPLDEEVSRALCGIGSEAQTWLELLDSVERGEWETVQDIIRAYTLPPQGCAVEYMKASTWAHHTLGHTQGEGDEEVCD
jgi:EAL and modified HD-GYP domain-containing signal transduction protein